MSARECSPEVSDNVPSLPGFRFFTPFPIQSRHVSPASPSDLAVIAADTKENFCAISNLSTPCLVDEKSTIPSRGLFVLKSPEGGLQAAVQVGSIDWENGLVVSSPWFADDVDAAEAGAMLKELVGELQLRLNCKRVRMVFDRRDHHMVKALSSGVKFGARQKLEAEAVVTAVPQRLSETQQTQLLTRPMKGCWEFLNWHKWRMHLM